MNIVLVLLYLVFTGILVFPFYYVYTRRLSGSVEEDHTIAEKRRLLLDNLKDLKMELDTGKLTESEFNELSRGLVLQLKQIDEKQPEKKKETRAENQCPGCKKELTIKGAKFCPFCGNSLAGL